MGSNPIPSSIFKIMDLHDSDKKSKPEIGRKNILGKRAASANDFNPLEWSKWLYEIRQQLNMGTSRAEAYEDCHKHYEEILKESSHSTSAQETQ
ncbi:MAG: hypothetical protein JST80_11435 [Bdellovibrionales bacterium]|nr:hypothetical protein [Bdellovibrionales bacterium]